MTHADRLEHASLAITVALAFAQRGGASDAVLHRLLEVKRDVDRERFARIKPPQWSAA